MTPSAAAEPPPAKQHQVRFTIRLHDGSPAAGAFVAVDACPGTFASESRQAEGPFFDAATVFAYQETYPVFQASTDGHDRCQVETKADSSGRVVIPYSGKSDVVLLATISHPNGKAQSVTRRLRGNLSIDLRMKRGSTSDVIVSCGTSPCEPRTVTLSVDVANAPRLTAYARTDASGLARFVGAPDGEASIHVSIGDRQSSARGRWRADVKWNTRSRPPHVRFAIDAPTYSVTAKAFRKPGLTGNITASARCQFDDGPGIVYHPPAPAHAAVPDGASFTFSELRGTCTLRAAQDARTFVPPSASALVTGAGSIELHIH